MDESCLFLLRQGLSLSWLIHIPRSEAFGDIRRGNGIERSLAGTRYWRFTGSAGGWLPWRHFMWLWSKEERGDEMRNVETTVNAGSRWWLRACKLFVLIERVRNQIDGRRLKAAAEDDDCFFYSFNHDALNSILKYYLIIIFFLWRRWPAIWNSTSSLLILPVTAAAASITIVIYINIQNTIIYILPPPLTNKLEAPATTTIYCYNGRLLRVIAGR